MKPILQFVFIVVLFNLFATSASGQWQTVNTPFNGTSVWIFENYDTSILAGTNSGIYKSYDLGLTWEYLGLSGNDVYYITVEGQDIYASTWGNGLLKSSDGGTTWSPLTNGIGTSYITSTFINGTDIFVCTDDGLYVSNIVSPDFTKLTGINTGINYIYINDSSLFAAAYDGVYKSDDYGSTWSSISAFTGLNVWQVMNSEGLLYATTSGNGLMVSDDGGLTWDTDPGIPETNVNIIFVNENIRYVCSNSGIYISANGSDWFYYNDGFDSDYSLWSMFYSNDFIFTGGYLSGLWMLPVSYIQPSALTFQASSIGYHSAKLSGIVSTGGYETTVTFEFGLSQLYGNEFTAIQSPLNGFGIYDVTADASGLDSNTVYHYRTKAVNSSGTYFGEDKIFITLVQYPEAVGISLGGLRYSKLAWGDYDNDDDPDLLVEGYGSAGQYVEDGSYTELYINNGDGTFSLDTASGFIGLHGGSVDWGDFNNDNFLDIFITGLSDYYGDKSLVYFNNGDGTFSLQAELFPVENGGADVGDVNNDGFPDIILNGCSNDYYDRHTKIYINNKNGTFSEVAYANLPGTVTGDVKFFDYNNDGNLDIILSGEDNNYQNITAVFNGFGNGLFEFQDMNLPEIYYNSFDCGDYDNDGFTDILMTGATAYGYSEPFGRLYRNNGDGTFTQTGNTVNGSYYGSGIFGDVNNDGWLDMLVTSKIPYSGKQIDIYLNNGDGTFTPENGIEMPGIVFGFAAFGDYDNDGKLDAAISGSTQTGAITNIYKNFTLNPNIVAGQPVPDTVEVTGQKAIITWSPGYYNTTPVNGLSYNVRLGKSLSTVEGLSPMANLGNGYRKVATTGNAGQSNSMVVNLLEPGTTYYYNIQAIDHTFAGSPFSTTGNFTTTYAPFAETKPATGISANSAILNGIVNANGLATSIYFEYGTDTNYGDSLAADPSVSSDSVMINVSLDLSGLLSAGTTYHFRIVAVSSDGTSYGEDMVFPTFIFNTTNNTFEALVYGSSEWGDIDNDGDLDLLNTGYSDINNDPLTKLYINQGDGSFTGSGTILPGVFYSSTAFGDYNNDGYLDFVIMGYDLNWDYFTKIYRNEGNGTFIQTSISLAGISEGDVSWFDYNNDGNLDIIICGYSSGYKTKIYKNEGNDVFTEQTSISIQGSDYGSVDVADYDKDGFADILISGYTNSPYYSEFTTIYKNDGNGNFLLQNSLSIVGTQMGNASWGDFNNDGYPDILINGWDNVSGGSSTLIYQNTGNGSFSLLDGTNFYGCAGYDWKGTSSWVDYDNDGWLDVAIAGTNYSAPYYNYLATFALYRNNGDNTFSLMFTPEVQQVYDGVMSFADYDNDGRMDMYLQATYYDPDWNWVNYPILYQNMSVNVNTAPSVPDGLIAEANGADVTFKWNKASDAETVQNGLGYNIKIGNYPGGINKLAPMSDENNGYRRIMHLGSTTQDTSFTIKGLGLGNYFWSVQTLDNNYKGSEFATEQQVDVFYCDLLNYSIYKTMTLNTPYVDLDTNGTIISTANFNDANSDPVDIGFNFNYNCNSFTQFILNTNGFIRLGDAPPSDTALFPPVTGNSGSVFASSDPADINLLFAFNHDLTGAVNPEYRVFTSGTAPDRICTIQFKNLTENTTTPPVQFSNIEFQIRLYETTNVIDFVYGIWTPSANPSAYKGACAGIKGSGNSTGQSIAVGKGSSYPWTELSYYDNNYPPSNFGFNFGNPPRPIPDPGITIRFYPMSPNDAAVSELYTLGKLPVPVGLPHSIKGIIRNSGIENIYNLPVYLNITGDNTYYDTLYIDLLLPNETVEISFNGFNPVNQGWNTVNMSVPDDEFNFNNSRNYAQLVNEDTYSYADTMPQGNAWGFDPGDPGAFLVKHHVNGIKEVFQVRAKISLYEDNIGHTVFGIIVSHDGTIIGQSDNYVITATDLGQFVTFAINNPPVINYDDFYAGMVVPAYSGIIFYPMASQVELPARADAYYDADITEGQTTIEPLPDLYRFIIEATVTEPEEPVATPNQLLYCAGDSMTVSFTSLLNFNTGNVFTLELSDASGSFNNPVVIATGSSSPVSGVIPGDTPLGQAYRVRVNSSDTATTGINNGIDITINNPLGNGSTVGLVSSNTPVCAGYSLNLFGPAITDASFSWTGPEGFISTDQNPVINNASEINSGDYTLIVIKDGCISLPLITSVNVIPVYAPEIIVNGSTTICPGDSVELYSEPIPGFNYQWKKNGNDITGATGPTYYAKYNGDYSITLIAGCGNLNSLSVNVNIIDPLNGLITMSETGLVAYYPFNGNANDESGNNYQGTISGASLTSDRDGNPASAYYFTYYNGNYIDCGTLPGTTFGNELTVSAWVYPTGYNGNAGIVTKGNGDYETFSLLTRDDNRFHFTGHWPYDWYDTPSNQHDVNQWYYVTGVFNNGNAKIYVNGVLENSNSWGITSLTNPSDSWLSVGVNQPGGWEFFNGAVDEVRVYNIAKSDSEISTLYNSVVNFAQSNSPVCTGESILLSALTVQDAIYSWSGPNGFTSGLQNPVIENATTSDSGNYQLIVTNNGCSTQPINAYVEVVLPPVVDLGQDLIICYNSEYFIDAANTGSNFQWNNGSTDQFVTISSPGTYSVTVTSIYGCVSSDEIIIDYLPPVQFNLPDTVIVPCDSSEYLLDAGAEFDFYYWNTGEYTQEKYIYGTGIYTVTVTDSLGCLAAKNVFVSLIPEIQQSTQNICSGSSVTLAGPDTSFSVISDINMKATPYYYLGWEQPGFDDSNWNNAVNSGCTGVVPGSDRIWCSPYADVSYFRKTFNLMGLPETAPILITADNAFDLYINGMYVGSGGSWEYFYPFDILPFLQTGDNLIAVVASNSSSCCQLTFSADMNNVAMYSYLWSNGETSGTINVSPLENTTYYVTISDGNQSCYDSVTVNVNPLPVLSFADTILVPCGTPYYEINAGEGYESYLWSNGESTEIINIIISGSYSCTITDQNGCSTSAQSYVSIIPPLEANEQSVCLGNSISIGYVDNFDAGLVAYFPFDGNADDESGNNNNGTVNGASLTTDRFGNQNSAYNFDGIDDFISGNADNFPTGERTISLWYYSDYLNISNILLGYGGNGCGTSWFETIGTTGTGTSTHCNGPSFVASQTPVLNTWTHLVMVTGSNGSKIFIDGNEAYSSNVFISDTYVYSRYFAIGAASDVYGNVPYTDPNIQYFSGKIDDVAIFDHALNSNEVQHLYNIGINGYYYAWSTGDSSSEITVNPSETTTYFVTVTDVVQTCTDSITVIVNPLPQLSLDDTTLVPCGTESFQLDAGEGYEYYTWNTGFTSEITDIYTSGQYSVTVTDINGCNGSDTAFISYINAYIPEDEIWLCPGSSADIILTGSFPYLDQNQAGIYDYDNFEYGQGSQDDWFSRNGVDPEITSSTAYSGIYSLYMPSSWGGNFEEGNNLEPGQAYGFNTDDYPYMSMAYKIPPGTLANMIVYVAGYGWQSITLTQGETPCNYPVAASWNEGSSVIANNQWHFKTINLRDQMNNNLGYGNYYITSIIWHDGGCMTPVTGEFWIDDFMITQQIPSDPVSANSFSWSTGETTTSIYVTPSETTTYYLTISDGIQSCTDSVTVNINPVITSALPDTIIVSCQDNSIVLDAGAGNYSYLWNTGELTQTVTAIFAGNYFVTISDDLDCVITDSVLVSLTHAEITATDTLICSGEPVTLETGNQFIQGQSVTGFTFSGSLNGHLYYISNFAANWWDAYTACLVAGGHLVTISSDEENIFVGDIPGGSKWLGFTDQDQEGVWQWVTGEPVNYIAWNYGEPNNWGPENYAQSNIGGYLWNDLSGGDNLPFILEFDWNSQISVLWSTGDTASAINISPLETTLYSVTVSDGINSCNDEITITVVQYPVVELGGDYEICGTDPVTLDAGNTGATYLWNDGSTGQTNVVTQTGTYSVTVYNGECTASDISAVTFYQLVVTNLGDDFIIYTGNTALLDAGPGGENYLWSTGETSQSIVVSVTGAYSVTVTNPCGSASGDINVSVLNPPLIEVHPTAINIVLNYGESGSETFSISNSGEDNLSFEIWGIPWWFDLSQTSGTITPGNFEELTLNLSNTLPGGYYSGQLYIYSNDPAIPLIFLTVDLTVYQTSMYVTPSAIDYGNVVKNTTSNGYVYLVNNGNTDITINSITTVAPYSAGSFSTILSGGQTMTVAIDFTPTSTLIYNKLLTINTSFGTFTVNLHGVGQNPAPGWSFSFTSYDFGFTDTATGGGVYLNIYNTGNVPAIITGTSSTSPNFTIGETSFSIPVGGSQQVLLGFIPDDLNTFNGVLSFTSSNCGVQLVTVNGTGMMVTTPPSLTYADQPPYNGVDGVNPVVGPTSQYFEYSVIYTDPDNYAPLTGYPKLGIDRNGDGDFLDSDEGWVTMSPDSAEDINYSDGKKYVYITNFAISAYLGYSFSAFNIYGNSATDEGTQYRGGPLVSNDLLDLSIYANDINFSDDSPAIGQEITIFATINNNSDYPADVPFVVQFWKEDTLMGEQTVNYLSGQSSFTLQMNHTFTYDEFYPIKVIVDAYNVLAEDNELNNFAIRPIIAGDFSVPGTIAITGSITPEEVYYHVGTTPPLMHYHGHAFYVGSFDPETDVSGATVSFTLVENGMTMWGYTDSNGDFDFYFYSPVPPEGETATYHIYSSVTDYTLTGESEILDYVIHSFNILHKPDLNSYHLVWGGWEPNIFWTDSCIVTGEPIDVSVYVWNSGDSVAYDVKFYGYKDVPTDTTFVAYYDTLYPGEARWEYFTVTFNTEGNHTVAIWADPDNTIEEWNEGNNLSSKTRHIYDNDIDLIPNSFWISSSSPLEGQNVIMSLGIDNILCNLAGSSVANLYDIFGTDTTLIAALQFPEIEPMSSNTQWFYDYSFTGVGTHTIMAVVDYNDNVPESNEENNTGYWQVEVPPSVPDLTFSVYPWYPLEYSLNVSATDVNPGDEINFTADIKNDGNGDASNFYVRFKVDNVLLGDPVLIPFLGAGQYMTLISDAWTIADCGHSLEVVIDEENLVEETHENNNFAEKNNIGLDLTPSPPSGSGWVNSQVIISSQIWNNGSFEADSIAVYYYCTNCDPLDNNLLLGFDVLPHVPAQWYTYSHTIYTFDTPGVKHIYAYADSTTNCEINEENNTAWGSIYIDTEKPDLMVHSYHILPTELNPDPGELINIYSSFENISNVAAGPFKVQFKVDSNPIGDIIEVPGLGPLEDTTVACSQEWSSTLIGPHIIRVFLDTNNEVDENSEMNNEASRAVIVGDAPDMKFANIDPLTITDYFPATGQWLTITAHIKDIGGEGGTANAGFYYINGTDSTLLQTLPFTLNDHDSLYLTIPWQASNNFGKIACVISDCDPLEFNLFNNNSDLLFGIPANPLEAVIITSATNICGSGSVQLLVIPTEGSGEYTVNWTSDNPGFTYSGNSLAVNISETTTFTAEISDGYDTLTLSSTINVAPYLTVDFSGLNESYCLSDDPSVLTGLPQGGIFSGNGIAVQSFYPQIAGTGTHNITYLYTSQTGCTASVTRTTEVLGLPQADLIIQTVSCHGNNDGNIIASLAGIEPVSFIWSNGDTTQSISGLSAGTYNVTIYNEFGCEIVLSGEVSEPAELELSFEFTYNLTNANSTIDLTVSGGTSPYSFIWSTGETTEDIIVTNNTFYSITITDTNGCLASSSYMAGQPASQDINMCTGWNLYSTYIDPLIPDINAVLAPVVNQVIIAKNDNGQVFWPAYGVNEINDMIIGEAYYIKMLSEQLLIITGYLVVPENTPVSLPQYWSYFGYLRQSPANISTMLNGIINNIVVVVDGAGNVYFPSWNIDHIGNMLPGLGYKVMMSSSDVLVYPANSISFAKSDVDIPVNSHFSTKINTGNYMLLGIPLSAWSTEPGGPKAYPGNEIGIFNQLNLLAGSGVFEGGNIVITIWGDDQSTIKNEGIQAGEPFRIILWDGENETILVVNEWQKGDEYYYDDRLSIVKSFTLPGSEETMISLYQNVPNPFRNETSISFCLPETSDVELSVYNVLCEKIITLAKGKLPEGVHRYTVNGKALPSGTYFYKLITPDTSLTKAMNVVK